MTSRMKTFLVAVGLVAIGVTACSSCANKTPAPSTPDVVVAPDASVTVTPVPPTPVPTTVKVSQDGWEFTLPSSGWDAMESPPAHSVALLNKDRKNIIVMVSEPFPGKYEEYVLMALRGVRAAGATITSAKQVEVNGGKFVLIESSKNGMRVWMWVTLIKGQGYGFSCGGAASDDSQHDLCFGVADTLKIN